MSHHKKRYENSYVKEVFDEGAVYIDSNDIDFQPPREPVNSIAPMSMNFHCDQPDIRKPKKFKRTYELPSSSLGNNKVDDFDWTALTQEAQEMLENVPMRKLVNETKQQLEVCEMMKLANEPEKRYYTLPERSMANAGNGVATKKSVFPNWEMEFDFMCLDFKDAAWFHLYEYCYFCNTEDHCMVNCPESPAFKLDRIQKHNLCGKCLHPEHLEAACQLREKVICLFCGANHLSYVYHA